ncbi:MAG TPA: hypothetical protein VN688_32410 [Gemmataceae bacterium]|nr:hypothetical protein [Gemmataceae bacterium]
MNREEVLPNSNPERKMPRKKKIDVPRLIVPDDATLEEIYAKARQEFTAADLQKYTEIEEEEGIPAEQVLAEMEKIHQQESRKRRKK